jgi:hypothetical protein
MRQRDYLRSLFQTMEAKHKLGLVASWSVAKTILDPMATKLPRCVATATANVNAPENGSKSEQAGTARKAGGSPSPAPSPSAVVTTFPPVRTPKLASFHLIGRWLLQGCSSLTGRVRCARARLTKWH